MQRNAKWGRETDNKKVRKITGNKHNGMKRTFEQKNVGEEESAREGRKEGITTPRRSMPIFLENDQQYRRQSFITSGNVGCSASSRAGCLMRIS